MKMFKRLAAVLLAGAMVLAMFTACGSKSLGQQFEDLTMEYFNLRAADAGMNEMTNDKDLKNEVYEILGHIDPETGLFEKGYELPEDINTQTHIKMYSVANQGGAPVEVTQEDIKQMQDIIEAMKNPAPQADNNITMKMGVASRVVGGKTYGGYIVEGIRSAPTVD